MTSAFVAPVSLLHATTVPRGAASPQSLLASSDTEVYLKLGSAATGLAATYYPVTLAHLSDQAAPAPGRQAQVRLSFSSSSLELLGEVLRAAADGGRISHVSLAFRAPGVDGRAATELVDTFATADVTSFSENVFRHAGGQRLARCFPRSAT